MSKVAEAVIVNSVASGLGINIMYYYFRDDYIEEAMLAILDTMTEEERDIMARICYEETLGCEKVAAVMALGRTKKDTGTPKEIMFEGVQDVLDIVGYKVEEKAVAERVERMVVGMKDKMRRSIPQSYKFRGGVRAPVPIPDWIIDGA